MFEFGWNSCDSQLGRILPLIFRDEQSSVQSADVANKITVFDFQVVL